MSFRVNFGIHALVSSPSAVRLACFWRRQFAPTESDQATTSQIHAFIVGSSGLHAGT
jgi:hypothetical protein